MDEALGHRGRAKAAADRCAQYSSIMLASIGRQREADPRARDRGERAAVHGEKVEPRPATEARPADVLLALTVRRQLSLRVTAEDVARDA